MPGGLRTLGFVAILLTTSAVGWIPAQAQAGPSLETILSGLAWPVAFAFAPDGRIFFAERFTGNIRIIEDGAVLTTPFFTLPGTATDAEQGLLGLALDPGFPAVPWVYAYQTYEAAPGIVYNRILRIRAEGNVGASTETVLSPIPSGVYHNGGVITFGPDGTLYATVGDNALPANAQDLRTLAGKVLRMNPSGTAPADNPFYGNASANPYVYTYGHRNMFGLVFHPVTGRAYLTENGPECNDEVNLLLPGRGYGWGFNRTCGTPPPPPLNTNQEGPDPVLPLAWYGTVIAPTNAIVYSGDSFPEWEGDLIFAEYLTRDLRRLDLGPPAYDDVLFEEIILDAPGQIADVDVGPDGAIWFTSSTSLYRYGEPTPLRTPPLDVGSSLLWPANAIGVATGAAALAAVVWVRHRRKARVGP